MAIRKKLSAGRSGTSKGPDPQDQEDGMYKQCRRESQVENLRRQRAGVFDEEQEEDRYADDGGDILPFDAD